MSTRIKTFIQLIEQRTGSKTFCVLPWIHLATRPNGDARLCCSANASGAVSGDLEVGLLKSQQGNIYNFGKQSVEEIFNSEFMCQVRLEMLQGQIPSSCTKCFEEEKNGVVSKRLWELHTWDQDALDIEQLISNTDADGTVPYQVQYLDLRLGNTCNLKCVMCSPHDSSRWTQDYDQLIKHTKSNVVVKNISFDPAQFDNRWHENSMFWQEIYAQIPNIKQLYFAGGEPLMIKEHAMFLKEIIKQGYAKNISLRYNSNGTFINQDIIDIWQQFRQVKFAFSIDAVKNRNHYIRFPSDWADVEQALNLLDQTPDHVQVSIACAVQVCNIKHLVDFAKWKLSKKYKKINQHRVDKYLAGGGIINLHLVYIPTFMSARILPPGDKQEIRKQLEEFKQWLWDNYTQDEDFWQHNPYGWQRWQAVLNFIEAESHDYLLPDFKEYVLNLDRIRGTSFANTFPELSHLVL